MIIVINDACGGGGEFDESRSCIIELNSLDNSQTNFITANRTTGPIQHQDSIFISNQNEKVDLESCRELNVAVAADASFVQAREAVRRMLDEYKLTLPPQAVHLSSSEQERRRIMEQELVLKFECDLTVAQLAC